MSAVKSPNTLNTVTESAQTENLSMAPGTVVVNANGHVWGYDKM